MAAKKFGKKGIGILSVLLAFVASDKPGYLTGTAMEAVWLAGSDTELSTMPASSSLSRDFRRWILQPIYGASKAAVTMLSESLAFELPRGFCGE